MTQVLGELKKQFSKMVIKSGSKTNAQGTPTKVLQGEGAFKFHAGVTKKDSTIKLPKPDQNPLFFQRRAFSMVNA